MTNARIRVMCVDDHRIVREGISLIIDRQPDMEVVGEAGDGLAATRMLRTTAADVVVMDVRMPRLDGIEATRQICQGGDRPRVLMLTTFDLDEYAYSALKAGASGFLLKDVPPEELLFGIRAVHSGDAVVAPSTTRRLIDRFAPLFPAGDGPAPPDLACLTGREREVLAHVARERISVLPGPPTLYLSILDHPERDDAKWMRHTLAWCDGGKVRLDYKPVTVTQNTPASRMAPVSSSSR